MNSYLKLPEGKWTHGCEWTNPIVAIVDLIIESSSRLKWPFGEPVFETHSSPRLSKSLNHEKVYPSGKLRKYWTINVLKAKSTVNGPVPLAVLYLPKGICIIQTHWNLITTNCSIGNLEKDRRAIKVWYILHGQSKYSWYLPEKKHTIPMIHIGMNMNIVLWYIYI